MSVTPLEPPRHGPPQGQRRYPQARSACTVAGFCNGASGNLGLWARDFVIRPLVAVALAALLLAKAAAPTTARADVTSRDARTVYCQSAGHREKLREAAELLRVIRAGTRPDSVISDGHQLAFADWVSRPTKDAERACDALIAADQLTAAPKAAQAGGFAETALILLPVLFGAGLTWLATEQRSGRDRSRELAKDLRARAGELRRAGTAFSAEWMSGGVTRPQSRNVDEGRDALLADLRRVTASRPDWKLPVELVDTIDSKLDEAVDGSWAPDPEMRRVRARTFDRWLRSVEGDVAAVAEALEHPVRGSKRARRAAPESATLAAR